jgi:DNA-binding winged helix-turn-helix (wHTH) protein/TolB-like protein
LDEEPPLEPPMNRTNNDDRGLEALGRSADTAGMCLIRLGDWYVEAQLNLLRRGEQQVRLEPKVMEVLIFLIGRVGEVVPRDVLLTTVWQGVVVGDDALTQAVIKLRKALGDDARAPLYIETVAKRGYRLVARSGTPDAVGDTLPVARLPAGKRNSGRTRAWLWPATATAAIGCMLVVAVALHRRAGPSPPVVEAVTAVAISPANAAATQPPQAHRPAVAVMPFDVLGEHPEQRYLARGLASELAMDLSRISELDVIRVDAAQRSATADEVAAAEFRVFGAVQRTQDQIAAEVQLVEGATGRELWSKRYYRPFGDLFAIRDEIEAQVATALSSQLGRAKLERDAGRYSRSVAAYDAFLRAKAALLVPTEDANDTAKDLYREAIRLDAAFARAYGGLALIHAADYRNQWAADGAAALSRAQDMAKAAVQIDPQMPEAHWVLGYVSTQRRHHDEALSHLDGALAVAPGFADAYALKGGIKTYVGEPSASIPLLRNAMRLEPTAGYLYFLLLGRAYFFLSDDEQARINLNEAIARNPANLEAHVYLAATLLDSGDRDGAEWETEEIRTLAPDFSIRTWLDTYPMTDAEQIERLTTALGSLNL